MREIKFRAWDKFKRTMNEKLWIGMFDVLNKVRIRYPEDASKPINSHCPATMFVSEIIDELESLICKEIEGVELPYLDKISGKENKPYR